ncbi:MAG: DNA mismatch repair protein MutS, partial [Chloroflexota bacterium]
GVVALSDDQTRVAVAEDDGEVVFLHQIVEGGADKSYGVHVARLAGMPGDVVNRAWELLDQLENMPGRKNDEYQLPMSFGEVPSQDNEALEALRSLDLSNMTPIEALNALFELQAKALDE